MSQIIKANSGVEAMEKYPFKYGDIIDGQIVKSLFSALEYRGHYRVSHDTIPYNREAELLNNATGVIIVGRD